MGRRTREFDWTSTPVGSPDTWPQSLRSAVSTLLHSKFPMFIWWGEELIQFYNDAYRPSLGNEGKHPAALGQRGGDCWPEIWPVIYPLIKQVLDGGDATWSEDQLIPIYRNGRMEDVYWTFGYSPLYAEGGKIAGVLVVCNENTEKVLNHQRLKESEAQLGFAIEAAELATWDLNPLTGKFTSNSRLNEWFGLKPSDGVELSLAINAMIPADRERVQAAIRRALEFESGGFYDIKHTIVNHLTGEERIVRAKGRAWFNEDRVAYRFNGTLQDITEPETARLRLVEAEQTARLAIESAALGTYCLDLRTEEIVASPRYYAILGYSGPVDRKTAASLVHPDDAPLRARANENSLQTGLIDYECRLIRPDGSQCWVKINGRVLFDEEGRPTYRVGVIQDITKQKEFAEQLTLQVQERTLELRRSNEDLMQFAHVITHDLKEPVRKVRVFSSRIKDEMAEEVPSKARLYLGKIQSATDRMIAMIEGVLDYSKVAVTKELSEPVDLNEILRAVETDLEILIQQKGASVRCDHLPTIEGINILLYQLFYNLVNNSLKFAREGVPPVIGLSASPADMGRPSMARIVLTDNGIGFDPQFSESIFHPFTRLNSKDRYEGTGLGLALCKKIVERHGGSIEASGEAGQGATFIIHLPITDKKIS